MLGWWWRVDKMRSPETTPAVGFGAPIDTGRSAVTPLALQLRQGGSKIVLSAQIENITGVTQGIPFGFPPRLPQLLVDGDALVDPDLILARDGTVLQQLQPRMPEVIEIVWQAPPDWQPAPVEIRFQRQQFLFRDGLYGGSSWVGFAPVAHLTAAPEITP